MEKLIVKNKDIKDMIYEIRGKQVMLDSDLAKLYGVETKRINEAVSRNKYKFPDRFSFQLTNEESKNFLVAICDQKETRGGRYKNPRVFAEQGVAMLATILKSPVATKVSIQIMDAFVAMRKFINNNADIFKRLIMVEYKLLETDERVDELFNKLESKDAFKEKLFFEGQIYDAYNLMMEILTTAKEEIIIIDNYAGRELFNLIKEIKIPIKIYTKNIDEEAKKKYQKQYNNIEIINTSKFHDRFIIVDNKTLYHCGSSFKELGKKCFGINKIEDSNYLNIILNELKGED